MVALARQIPARAAAAALLCSASASLCLTSDPGAAHAETHRVTNDEQLFIASRQVKPGDVIEIEGGKTYKGRIFFEQQGEPNKPITVRGIKKDGKRPILKGGDNTVYASGNHYLFESIELTGGTSRCMFVLAHEVTMRDMVIRDCPALGLLSADRDSGTLVVDRCEFYGSGKEGRLHQIYVTTDQNAYPGAVCRLQSSYIHDANGGNNVKSRAERNEIYFNWIEGALYHELELIGPDVDNPPERREDSDVVGNVLVKGNPEAHGIRIGGDGTMDTDGRFRFVNNTFVMLNGDRSAIRLFDGVESVELYNNVFVTRDGSPVTLFRTDRVKWTRGKALVTGSHNYIPTGSREVLDGLSNTVGGADAKLVDLAGFDFRPADGSPLVDAGTATRPSNPEAPFPRPLGDVATHPPSRSLGPTVARPSRGTIDIGAFEAGPLPDGGIAASAAPSLPSPTPGPGEPPTPAASTPNPVSSQGSSRCFCAAPGGDSSGTAPIGGVGILVGLMAFARRRRD